MYLVILYHWVAVAVCVNFACSLTCLRSLYLLIQKQIPVVTPHIWNIGGKSLFLYDLLPSEQASCHCQGRRRSVSIYGQIQTSFRTFGNLTYHKFLSLSKRPCTLSFIYCVSIVDCHVAFIFTAFHIQYCVKNDLLCNNTTLNITVGCCRNGGRPVACSVEQFITVIQFCGLIMGAITGWIIYKYRLQ